MWPSIALEVGYSEPYEKLLEDVTLLLEGSKGRIGLVILIKIIPLEGNETVIQSGFIELYTYDQEEHKGVKQSGRMVRFLLYLFSFSKINFLFSGSIPLLYNTLGKRLLCCGTNCSETRSLSFYRLRILLHH
jgi:hypothetical protein